MRARNMILVGLLVFPACDDDPIFVPAPPAEPTSPEGVVENLARAYKEKDGQVFKSLLANAADRNAEYLFLLSAPTEFGETQWGFAEEARIHQRMFDPAHPPAGESPPASDIWLESVSITLTKQEPFAERTGLYTTAVPPGPLNPEIWRAMDARYSTYVFFDMAGFMAYKVEGEANFVVIEDLTKNVGDQGKFLLYIWEDIPAPYAKHAGTATEITWGAVKALYR